MGMEAMAFLRPTSVVSYELACSRCPIVCQITHDPLCPLPQHRCKDRARAFDIVLECDELVLNPGRIDRYWLTESHS